MGLPILHEFSSRKYRSIEVGSHISKWENSEFCEHRTSDSEIRVGKYEFPSPMERSISACFRFGPYGLMLSLSFTFPQRSVVITADTILSARLYKG